MKGQPIRADAVAAAVRDLAAVYHRAPMTAEIAGHLGLKQMRELRQHLHDLAAAGVLYSAPAPDFTGRVWGLAESDG